MTGIKPIGDFYEVDANGYLNNPCSLDKIPMQLRPLLRELGIQYRQNLGSSLMGIYLRGSVPAGKAVPMVSDIDVLGLMKWHPHHPFTRWERPFWADDADRVLMRMSPSITQIDHAIAHHDPAFPGQNISVKMILKTQSVCIWGEDVIPSLPGFKVDQQLCIHQKWVEQSYDAWKELQDEWTSVSEKRDFVRSFSKIVLRSGFELVMLRERRYTQDLYLCYSTFAKYFPKQEEAMRSVLLLFLNPVEMDREAAAIFEGIVPWLLAEIDRQ